MRAGAVAGTLCIASTGVAAAAEAPDTEAQTTPKRAAKSAQRGLMVGGRRLHVKAGRRVVVKGRGDPGSLARLQIHRDGDWRTLGKERIDRDGSFRVRGRAVVPDRAAGRVVSRGQKRRIGRVHVYRYAQASWYGPGLYGGHLACGGTLTPGTEGVAHKSLPCGTKVTLRKGSTTVRVPVVDRGPYVGGREYDLTAATADELGFRGVGSILTTR